MAGINLAILGATGVVGSEILNVLENSTLPINSLKLLSSARSAGKKITFKGNEYTVIETKPEEFEGVDIVLASAGGSTSLALAKEAVKCGSIYIDNSSAFRMDKDVPLVIAGVNDEDLKWNKGIVANPNCSTSQLMLVLKPLHDYAKIKQMIVSTYQAVSGAGLAAINELKESTIAKNKGEDYDLYGTDFNCGDVTTTIIKCANGETITLNHDCCLPRPYSRDYMVQGTKGIYEEAPDGYGRIYIEGQSEKQHEWDSFKTWREKYEHPLWQAYENDGIKAGHGGMDFLVLSAYVDSLNHGSSPIDVYDTAAWMAVTCLSEQSVALGGAPVAFPDFTNGKWIDREPYRTGTYCLNEVCEVSEEHKEK